MLNVLTFVIGLAILAPSLYLMHILRTIIVGVILVVGYLAWLTFKPKPVRYGGDQHG